jgi:hypothetical protein
MARSASSLLLSNVCATAESVRVRVRRVLALVIALHVGIGVTQALAQARQENDEPKPASGSGAATAGLFVAGAAIGLLAHEGGHLLLDVAFDADPGFRRVEFHGIPFFAITHSGRLSPGREFAVSSAGFWVQHAGAEWILTRRPRLRHERAPVAKGVLAFNVIASTAYAGAAFFRTGPPERDTRGMAVSAGIAEPWVGAAVLAPAALDTWRYLRPDSRTAVWLSRGAKIAGGLLILRAAAR